MAIYTQRGACGSIRVATRIVGGRVYSEDQSYRARGGVGKNGVVRVAVSALADMLPSLRRWFCAVGFGGWAQKRVP